VTRYLRFEIFVAAIEKNTVLWRVTPCSLP